MEEFEKAMLIVDLPIYNTVHHKHGIISHVCIKSYGFYWNGFYSKEDNNDMILYSDFKKGIIKFEMIQSNASTMFNKIFGEGLYKKAKETQLDKIKQFMGKDFNEDCLYYVDDDVRREEIEEYDATRRNNVIHSFYLGNLFNRKKYNTMFEVEHLVDNRDIAYLYMLLSDYDRLLREKYGEPEVGVNYPMWINSKQIFKEEDILS